MNKIRRLIGSLNKPLCICVALVIIGNILSPIYSNGIFLGFAVGVFFIDTINNYYRTNKDTTDNDEIDNIEYKLEKVMRYATGGFLSNTNLSYETIEDAIKEHIKECTEEAVKKTKKDYGIDGDCPWVNSDNILENIDNIDYTHLLGYPSEVVATEIIGMVKEAIK